MFDGDLQFLFVLVRHRFLDLSVEYLKMSPHDAREIHERHIHETAFQVCQVHGKSVYDIFARVSSRAGRFYRQHVRERERERVAHLRRIGRNRVQQRSCNVHGGHDAVVYDHHGD